MAPFPYAAPTPEHSVLVVTTYQRPQMLSALLSSVTQMTAPPGAVVLVDNAGPDSAEALLAALGPERPLAREQGRAARTQAFLPHPSGPIPLLLAAPEENLGGAGGFALGLELARSLPADFLGAESPLGPLGLRWFWVMDDDVAVLPDALERLCARVAELEDGPEAFRCPAMVHGQRLNADGSSYFWRHRMDPLTGIHWPMTGADRTAPTALTNVACFEGAFLSVRALELAGLPDARFFIHSDDTTYGAVLSRRAPVLVTDVPVLMRQRSLHSVSLGTRDLAEASDLGRRHALRNRALMRAHLLPEHPTALQSAGFALGTGLAAGKELLRLGAAEALPTLLNAVQEPKGQRLEALRLVLARAGTSLRAIRQGLKESRSSELRDPELCNPELRGSEQPSHPAAEAAYADGDGR